MTTPHVKHVPCRKQGCHLTATFLLGSDESGIEVCGRHLNWGLDFMTGADRPTYGTGAKSVVVRTHSGWMRA
jgi:hypothetical protein